MRITVLGAAVIVGVAALADSKLLRHFGAGRDYTDPSATTLC